MLLPRNETGLPRDSVANASLVVALDKQVLTERVRKIPRRRFELILAGIDIIWVAESVRPYPHMG